MTQFLYCKKAEIIDIKTKQATAASVRLDALDSLILTLPRDYPYKPGVPVLIRFYDPMMGVVGCRCTLSAPLVSDDHRSCSYRCSIDERLSQIQRREDMKISLTAPATVSCGGRRASAVLHNISAGGVYLTTGLTARPGERLSFEFAAGDAPIPLTAEILRMEPLRDASGQLVFGYGCRFVQLSSQYEAQLRSYVFREERKLYQAK